MSKQIDLHVLEFYQPKKLLGSGAYGHVWKVVDRNTKQIFALKKIFDAFQNSTDAQRTYRQISLLHQMEHKNVVKLNKVIKAKNKKDLYLVFEYMQSDLHSLVGESILTSTHITFVIYQILKALNYVHSAQLIHRDLKPSNVLINSQCEIKLCDFGLARSLAHEEHEQNILSEQVATRWYRSPQILLSSQDYSKPTDIWSVGCIAAELMIGHPIFQGDSTLNQLQKIVQFTGMPSKYSVDSLKSDVAENIINNLTVRKKSIQDYFRKSRGQSSELINMTIRMLDFNPNKRPTVELLLKSEIFQQFQKNCSEQDELCQKFIVPQIDDNIKLTLQQYRKIIYKDIERRYPQFNDAVRIKSIYAVKHKSLLQKNQKKSLDKNHSSSLFNNSNLHKSMPKKIESAPYIGGLKKSVNKKQAYKTTPISPQSNLEYVKCMFSRANKIQKPKEQKDPANKLKQMAKTNVLHNENTSYKGQNMCEKNNPKTQPQMQVVRKCYKSKKASKQCKLYKQCKQNSPDKDYNTRAQQKASVYNQELKRMKSSKNQIKNKISKPKFQKVVHLLK